MCAGSLYPPSCVVSGSALADLATGATRYLSVLATDAFGNVLNSQYDGSGAVILFQLAITGAETRSTALVYAGSGLHEQSFTPLTVGTYGLAITYRGVAVAASPYTMTASASERTRPPAGPRRAGNTSRTHCCLRRERTGLSGWQPATIENKIGLSCAASLMGVPLLEAVSSPPAKTKLALEVAAFSLTTHGFSCLQTTCLRRSPS